MQIRGGSSIHHRSFEHEPGFDRGAPETHVPPEMVAKSVRATPRQFIGDTANLSGLPWESHLFLGGVIFFRHIHYNRVNYWWRAWIAGNQS
jgi:hypothetical protein